MQHSAKLWVIWLSVCLSVQFQMVKTFGICWTGHGIVVATRVAGTMHTAYNLGIYRNYCCHHESEVQCMH